MPTRPHLLHTLHTRLANTNCHTPTGRMCMTPIVKRSKLSLTVVPTELSYNGFVHLGYAMHGWAELRFNKGLPY